MDSSTTYVPQSQVWVSGTPSMLCFLESDWKCYIWHWNGKRKKLKSSKKRPTFSKCSFSFKVKTLQQPLLKLTYLLNPSNVKLQANYLTEFTWKNEYYDDVISSLWWRKQYLLANLLVTLRSYLPLYLLQVPKYDQSYLSDDTRALAYLGLLEAVSRPQRGLSTTCTSWEQA